VSLASPSGQVLTFLALDLDAICNIAVQILEKKAPCQQDPGQDDDQETSEDQAEYDSILISSALDLVAALSFALGPDFSQGFNTFFPPISYYVSVFYMVRMNYMDLILYKRQRSATIVQPLLAASLKS
jgi:hypothetical protein